MLRADENDHVTRVGPGTPMGDPMRRYWVPAMLSSELPRPDCPPVRVLLLGEKLIAFRDTQGRVGLLDNFCRHRGASLFFGRSDECGLRCDGHPGAAAPPRRRPAACGSVAPPRRGPISPTRTASGRAA